MEQELHSPSNTPFAVRKFFVICAPKETFYSSAEQAGKPAPHVGQAFWPAQYLHKCKAILRFQIDPFRIFKGWLFLGDQFFSLYLAFFNVWTP